MSKPLRILFAADVPPDPNSGAAGTEYQTIEALKRLGHQVDAVWAEELGRRIEHGNLHYLLELPQNFLRVFREGAGAYDVYHFNQGHAWLAAREHRLRGLKSVFVGRSHGWDEALNKAIAYWTRKRGWPRATWPKHVVQQLIEGRLNARDGRLCREADGVIVSSGIDRDYILRNYGGDPDRVACIAQAPAATFFEEGAPERSEEACFQMLYVSHFIPMKGYELVAHVVRELLPRYPQARLTWVCARRDHERVWALLGERGFSQVRLLDNMPQAQLREVYREHGVFLYPSFFDGFGKVFLEAMACGMAVVGTRVGGLADIIRHGESGLLSEPGDEVGLCRNLERVWAEPSLWRAMGRQAREVASRYTWERTAMETADFYRRLLAMKANRS